MQQIIIYYWKNSGLRVNYTKLPRFRHSMRLPEWYKDLSRLNNVYWALGQTLSCIYKHRQVWQQQCRKQVYLICTISVHSKLKNTESAQLCSRSSHLSTSGPFLSTSCFPAASETLSASQSRGIADRGSARPAKKIRAKVDAPKAEPHHFRQSCSKEC